VSWVFATDLAPRSPWQNPYVERLIGTERRPSLLRLEISQQSHCADVGAADHSPQRWRRRYPGVADIVSASVCGFGTDNGGNRTARPPNTSCCLAQAVPLPANIGYAEGACFGIPALTALQADRRQGARPFGVFGRRDERVDHAAQRAACRVLPPALLHRLIVLGISASCDELTG
jgi:hypothetical protein